MFSSANYCTFMELFNKLNYAVDNYSITEGVSFLEVAPITFL